MATKHLQWSEGNDWGEKGCFQEENTDDVVSELALKEAVKVCQRKGQYISGIYANHKSLQIAAVQSAREKGPEKSLITRLKSKPKPSRCNHSLQFCDSKCRKCRKSL